MSNRHHSLHQLHIAHAFRVATMRRLNPSKPSKEEQMSTFVDPRSQARVAEQLAPVPVAKKRTYKAKPKVTALEGLHDNLVPKSARIYGTMDADGI